jgi:hypothetical protein
MDRSRPSSYEERQKAEVDHSKCLCRMWNKERLDNIQCSRRAVDGNFCKSHTTKISEHGSWWLGIVTEPRPEKAMGPPSKPVDKQVHHEWYDQVKDKPKKSKKTPKQVKKEKTPKEGEEKTPKQVKKEKTPKVEKPKPKKRGLPKKEKKVSSKDEQENNYKIIKSVVVNMVDTLINEEIDSVIDSDSYIDVAGGVGLNIEYVRTDDYEYVEDLFGSEDEDESLEIDLPHLNEDIELDDEESTGDDDEKTEEFEIEGITYLRLLNDDMIIDPKKGYQMCLLKDGKFEEFFDDDALKIHKKNKKKKKKKENK